MTTVSFQPMNEGLSVDINEQFVCICSSFGSFDVWRLNANTGNIIDAQRL